MTAEATRLSTICSEQSSKSKALELELAEGVLIKFKAPYVQYILNNSLLTPLLLLVNTES